MRIVSAGHAVFAATIIALGAWSVAAGDFAAIWQVPKGTPAREVLVYITAVISLASGVGLLWQRAAASAAGVLLALLLLWLLLFKATLVLRAPGVAVYYENWGETAVIAAGAWILFAWFAAHPLRLAFVSGDDGVRIARVLYAVAMIAFGVAHFAYIKQTAALVPGWLPAHVAWAYFTGGAYIAAGLAMLAGVYARLAATLSAAQMGVFTLLVWASAIAAGPTADQWSEFVVSWALTVSGWVVADSYRGTPWLSVRKPRPA